MIESDAATIYQPAQRLSGQVLFKNEYVGDAMQKQSRPGFWLMVSQAAAAGVFVAFVIFMLWLRSLHFPYNFLLVAALPQFLLLGLGVGTLKGVTIWASSKLFRRMPGPFVRSTMSALGLVGIWLLTRPHSPSQNPDLEVYISPLATSLFAGITIGVVTGSSLRPWHELVRGSAIPGQAPAILAGVTGAILRLALVFLCMRSVALLLFISPATSDPTNLLWIVLGVWHFAAALVVVTLRLKFWQLQALATIVNVPVAMCLVRYREELGVVQYFIFGYLDVWLLFLLARWRPTYKLLAVLNEEIHYYLID